MNDRVLGASILVASLVGLAVYFFLVFISPWAWLVVQLSAFLAVAAVLLMVAWVGYTMTITPPPVPPEGIDLDAEPAIEEGTEEKEKEPKNT